MTILIVRVVPEGIIFGADRNITETRIKNSSGGNIKTLSTGQSQSPKVLKWPNDKAIIGYAGVASIAQQPTEEWLFNFIGRNLDFPDFNTLAHKLREEIENQRKIDEGSESADALLIHIGGFEERHSQILPTIWYIRNASILKKGKYYGITKSFICDDPFWQTLKEFDNESKVSFIKKIIKGLADSFNPFGFQQGIDLEIFNMIEYSVRLANKLIENNVYPEFSTPQDLESWKKHIKWTILSYSAFYQTFNPPGEQYVGGGVDIVSLKWPQ